MAKTWVHQAEVPRSCAGSSEKVFWSCWKGPCKNNGRLQLHTVHSGLSKLLGVAVIEDTRVMKEE